MKINALLLSVFTLLTVSGAASTHAQEECGVELPCSVGSRSYYALPPDGWDGKTPLPVMLHFHGWGRQGKLIVNHGRIAGATRKKGVLLLAPNGNGRSWSFWSSDTDDIPFARDVLADAAKRWPIDKSRILVSGYSYGSAMAWRFACAEGSRISALLAIAGTLPDQSEECATPVHIRHVHGTRDTVMDFPFGPNNDVTWPVKLWRDRNGCEDNSLRKSQWQARKKLPFTRHIWNNCASGKQVILDVHKRGHFIPRFWIARQLKELL